MGKRAAGEEEEEEEEEDRGAWDREKDTEEELL